MAAFFATVAGKILISLLSALGGWLLKHFQIWQKDRQETAAAEKKTADATDALQKAETPGEIDNAAKGVADDF